MKKKILAIFFIVIILFLSFFVRYKNSCIYKDITNVVNGYIVRGNNKIFNIWRDNYYNLNFYKDEDKFILLEDITALESYSKNFNDNFEEGSLIYIEPTEKESKVADYFSIALRDKDLRVHNEKNQLYVYYKDFHFGTNPEFEDYDFFEYDHFYRAVNKNEITKKIMSQAQQSMSVEFVDKYKEDGKTIYVYYDKDLNKSIKVAVKSILGFVTSCETVY